MALRPSPATTSPETSGVGFANGFCSAGFSLDLLILGRLSRFQGISPATRGRLSGAPGARERGSFRQWIRGGDPTRPYPLADPLSCVSGAFGLYSSMSRSGHGRAQALSLIAPILEYSW